MIVQVAQFEDLLDHIQNTPEITPDFYQLLDQLLLERLRGRLDKSTMITDFGENKDCAICFDELHADDAIQCK